MIEELKNDLKLVTAAIPTGPLVTATEVSDYLRNNLLPFVESMLGDMEEIDDSVFALVHETEDILHSTNAAVFAAVIASSTVLVAELRKRIGNDRPLLKAVHEFNALVTKATAILNEITVPDEDEDEDEVEETEVDGQSADAAAVVGADAAHEPMQAGAEVAG